MSTTHSTPKDSTDSGINSLDEVRERVVSVIADALLGDRPVLIDALPATGKSHGLVKAVNQTSEQVVIFTQRGREEQYDEYEKRCSDLGLTCKTLPAVDETCPTFRGDHGEKKRSRVHDLHNAGASPGHIHGRLNLPCQNSGPCPYEEAVKFVPDDYDVLVGHPYHAYVDEYLENRVPVFDEFPGEAYLEEIKNTPEVVTEFLKSHPIPFQNHNDLLTGRSNEQRRRRALKQIQSLQLVNEGRLFTQNRNLSHKLAGLCVLALLESEDLGNGWEHTILGGGRVGLFDREKDTIYILNPPNLPDRVVGLDGTPTKPMWDLALGSYDRRRRLNHQRVFDDDERRQYLLQVQNLRIVPTTEDVRPYSGGNTNPRRDAALLQEIARRHPGKRGVISTKDGLRDLEEEVDGLDDWQTAYYGNLLGSNELGDVDVGVVLGSTHYGDSYVKKWGALASIAVQSNGGQGLDKSYGQFGNKVLQQMRENSVLQALFRFARQGNGATVYVDTAALPEWIPVVATPSGTNISTRTLTQTNIIRAITRLEEARTKEIAKKVDKTPQYVRRVLGDLLEENYVSRRDAADGRGGAKVWIDEQLDQVNPYGQVDLPEMESPTRFSKHISYRTTKGFVSKKSPNWVRTSREREQDQQAEFKRRRHRQIQQMEMERWYGSD